MSEDCKINIESTIFNVSEIFNSKSKIFTDILGVDWCVTAKPVKKLEYKKSFSIRKILLITNRIQVTVQCKHLQRKVLAQVKILSCPMKYPNMKDMVFDHICEEGDNSISSEIKLDPGQEYSYDSLLGAFSLYVSPENFFYFKFLNDYPAVESCVSESNHHILRELTDDLSELHKKQNFEDVDIKCGDEVFKAHKVILSARSPVFAAMFQHKMKESEENVIEMNDMNSDVLSIFLEFIYSGKIDRLSTQTAGDLLSAAEQYQLIGLKKACLAFLQCAMSVDNVLSTLSLADLHDTTLKKISIDFMCKEFDHLKITEEWETFQKEKTALANEVLWNIIGFASGHGHKLC